MRRSPMGSRTRSRRHAGLEADLVKRRRRLMNNLAAKSGGQALRALARCSRRSGSGFGGVC